jgi:MYXO-CTERM domain-containing protein
VAFAAGFVALAAAACVAPPTQEQAPAPRTGAIFGGTTDSTHTAVMALVHWTMTGMSSCSGTIIDKTATTATMLTAQHCVAKHDASGNIARPVSMDPPAQFTVVPDTDWLAGYYAQHRFSVIEIVPAGGYDGRVDSAYDVALVRIHLGAQPVDVIPILEPADDKLAVGSFVTLVGYGRTEVDAGTRNTERRTVGVTLAALTATHLAWDQTNGKGHCKGDSGGPALFQTASGLRVAGIAEYADANCTSHGASVRVSSAAPWIHKMLEASRDGGVPDAATGADAFNRPDATSPPDVLPPPPDAPLAPSCGKITDPRADCSVCMSARCCFEARLCSSDPLCMGCGANPLASCYLYPPAAAFAACLATCPGNPCGITPQGADAAAMDVRAEAPRDAVEAPQDLAETAPETAGAVDTGTRPDVPGVDAAQDRPPTEGADADAARDAPLDEVSPTGAADAPAEAGGRADARSGAEASNDGPKLVPDHGCGCDAGGDHRANGALAALLLLIAAATRRRGHVIVRRK